LNVEVPDLHVGQAVILVDRVVAFRGGRCGEAIDESVGGQAGELVAVGLDVGPRRLEGEVLHEFHVLAVGEVNAIPGSDDGVLDRVPGDADARGEIILFGVDQSVRIVAGVGSVGVGQDGRGQGVIEAGVQCGETIVLFRIRREVFIAQAGVDGQIGQRPPVVLSVRVDDIFAEVGLLVWRLQAGLLGEAEEHVGREEPEVEVPPGALELVPGASV